MEVQVEYDYTAEERDELTLKQGDILTNVSQFEEGWYIGTLNGREGVFPDNFVRIIKPAPVRDNQPEHSLTALHNSPTKLGGDESEKATGSSTKKGALPSSALSTIPALISSKPSDYVKVVYEYTPAQSDELKLEVNDFINVLSRDLPEEGWWHGVNLRTNKTGVFPDNFVKMADPHDPDLKRAIADYKMSTISSTNRLQNGGLSSSKALPSNGIAVSPINSKRDSGANKNGSTALSPQRYTSDSRKRNDLSDSSPGENDRFSSKQQNKRALSASSALVTRTDGRPAGKTESSRSGRAESAAPKVNGAPTYNRKNTISKPECDTSTKGSVNKVRCSSLTRLDPNRPPEGTPRNMGDLQSQVNEQKERLSAVADQLENFGDIINSIRQEQREHEEGVAGQLREINRQLTAVKTAQVDNQAAVYKSLKNLTDRLRSLMVEVDEIKKVESENMVELNRIKKVVLDIDNRTMLSGVVMNGAGEDYDGQPPDLSDINGHNSRDPQPWSRLHASTKPPTGHR